MGVAVRVLCYPGNIGQYWLRRGQIKENLGLIYNPYFYPCMHSPPTLPYLFCFVFAVCAAAAHAQADEQPPADLHAFFCHPSKYPSTAWEQWLTWMKRERPKKLFLPPPQFDFGMTTPMTTPSTPEDDPFAKNLKLYNQRMYVFGVSGAKGFNLRNWPRTWPQIRQFLKLGNFLNLRRWLPQPESNALRMQNMIGASFYFHF